MPTRQNQQTGQIEHQDEFGNWVEGEDPNTIIPQGLRATPGANQARPAAVQPMTRIQAFGEGARQGAQQSALATGAGLALSPLAPPGAVAAITVPLASAMSGWLNAPVNGQQAAAQQTETAPINIDMGDTGELPPHLQAYIDGISNLSGGGGGSLPPMTPVAAPGPVTVDPGLEVLANQANRRQEQVAGLIDEMRAELQRDNPAARNNWQRLGEWLSAVAANGDITQAGAIANQMISRDREMQRELRRETMLLTMQGFGFEDAAAQAQARLLSGRHSAQMQTQDRQYQYQAGEAQRTDAYNMMGYQAQQQAAARQMQAQIAALEAQFNVGESIHNRRQQALSSMSQVPELRSQALNELAPEGFGPEASQAWASQQERQIFEGGLVAFAQSNGENPRELARVLMQFDPQLNRRFIERNGVQAALMRAISSPNAMSVYRANPELAAMARFQQAPAQ